MKTEYIIVTGLGLLDAAKKFLGQTLGVGYSNSQDTIMVKLTAEEVQKFTEWATKADPYKNIYIRVHTTNVWDRRNNVNKLAHQEIPTKKSAAEIRTSLRKKLIRLAYADPTKRAEILPLLDKLGAARKTAGCEKLPEGGMRDNCEKKVEEGAKNKKDDKKDDKKATDTTVTAGCEKLPEGGMRENCEKKVEEGKKKDDKKAALDKQAVKDETNDFGSWASSVRQGEPMTPHEVENIINTRFGIETGEPRKKRPGPRFLTGDLVEIVAAKHKKPQFDISNYTKFNGKIGTVTEGDGLDVLVRFKSEPESIRFPGGMSATNVGLMKYTEPFVMEGSAKMEMIYARDPSAKPTQDQILTVRLYLGRGRKSEKRNPQYYTGHIVSASTNAQGQFYFLGYPQQRARVDPAAEGGFQARNFNPTTGKIIYLGVFGQRPPHWKKEFQKMQEDAGELETADSAA